MQPIDRGGTKIIDRSHDWLILGRIRKGSGKAVNKGDCEFQGRDMASHKAGLEFQRFLIRMHDVDSELSLSFDIVLVT